MEGRHIHQLGGWQYNQLQLVKFEYKLQDSTCLLSLHAQQGLQSSIPHFQQIIFTKSYTCFQSIAFYKFFFQKSPLETSVPHRDGSLQKIPYPLPPPRWVTKVFKPSCRVQLRLPELCFQTFQGVLSLHRFTMQLILKAWRFFTQRGFGTNDFFGTNDWEYTRHIPSGTWGGPLSAFL